MISDGELFEIRKANQSPWMRKIERALLLGMFTADETSEPVKQEIRQLLYQAIHESGQHFMAYSEASKAYGNIGDEASVQFCRIREYETNPWANVDDDDDDE